MSNIYRLLALLMMIGSMVAVTQVPAQAESCDTSQFIADCNNADNAAYAACADACWRQFHAGVQYYGGGTCHWYGENDPGNCIEDYGDDCSCFSYYTYGQCYCDIL